METSLRQNAGIAGTRERSWLLRAAVLFLLPGLGACHDSTGPGNALGLSVRTLAPTIHFTRQVPGSYNQIVVPLRITNASDKTLNLAYCSESLERFNLLGWQFVWGPVCLAQDIRTLPAIAPGSTLDYSVTVYDTAPQYEGFRFTDPANVYRVRLLFWVVDNGSSQPVSPDAGLSNPFEVVP